MLLSKRFILTTREGHLKTSSYDYNINVKDSYIHLTNYSVQKHTKEFGKFEHGNEVSFNDFQDFLDKEYSDKGINVRTDLWDKMKRLITLSAKSAGVNPNGRKYSFEIFGYDFIVDKEFNIFLLEVNTNPGLEESSPLIKMLIPRMIDDALKLTIDKIFSPRYDSLDSSHNVDGYLPTDILWDYVCNYA
jgi:hypothetical protein